MVLGKVIGAAGVFFAMTMYIGPRQLPLVAQMAGRAVGRSVVVVQQAKSAWERASNSAELNDVRHHMQRDLDALRRIRNEIKYAPTSVRPIPTKTTTTTTPQQQQEQQQAKPSE